MGLFGWIRDKIRDVVDWVAGKLGGGSYSGSSVQETVDVEKVLGDFKENLKQEAADLEKKNISKVTENFDAFVAEIQETYPNLIPALRKKRRELYSNLSGSIVNYAEKHISENDSEFQKVLKMQPGDTKKQALRQRMNLILQEAESAFYQKLCDGMETLHKDLGDRLNSELSAKERQLEKELQDIADLTKQVEGGTVNLEKYENDRLLLSETAACLEVILDRGEMGT